MNISHNIFYCTQYVTDNNNYCNTCIKRGKLKKNLITDLAVGPCRSSGPGKSVVTVVHSFHPKCTIVLQHWYSRARCFVLTCVNIIYYITAGERRRPSSTVGIRFRGPQYCRFNNIIIKLNYNPAGDDCFFSFSPVVSLKNFEFRQNFTFRSNLT